MTARGSRGSSLAVSVLVTLLAVAGAITLVIRLPGRAGEMADAGASASAPPPAAADASASALSSATPSAASVPTPRQHWAKPRPAPSTLSPSPASPSAMPARTRPASTPSAGLAAAAQQVLALINQARAQAGLAAYTVSSGLDTSARGTPP